MPEPVEQSGSIVAFFPAAHIAIAVEEQAHIETAVDAAHAVLLDIRHRLRSADSEVNQFQSVFIRAASLGHLEVAESEFAEESRHAERFHRQRDVAHLGGIHLVTGGIHQATEFGIGSRGKPLDKTAQMFVLRIYFNNIFHGFNTFYPFKVTPIISKSKIFEQKNRRDPQKMYFCYETTLPRPEPRECD